MRYQRLDLNLIPALKALLAKKNITRAGEELRLSQPAMSAIVARLRSYFDDPLIMPIKGRMELTALAESLISPVNDLMLRIDAAIATRPDVEPIAMNRCCTVQASDYVQTVLMCEVLERIKKLAPGITWRFRPSNGHASDLLESGEVDLVIHPSQLITQSEFSEALFDDSYVMVVSACNDNVGDVISLEHYMSLGHVSFQSDKQGSPLFESWFADRYGGNARRVEVSTSSFHLLPKLIIGTPLVATMHVRMASILLRDRSVRLVRPTFEVPKLVEVLQWHRYRDQDPVSRWLRARIVESARRLPSLQATDFLARKPSVHGGLLDVG